MLFQSRLRGGASPDEVATRYVTAVRAGDRVALFFLSHPDAALSPAFDGRIEKYRSVSAANITIAYQPHAVAAYFMTVAISAGGTPFDTLSLEYDARRWYIVKVGD